MNFQSKEILSDLTFGFTVFNGSGIPIFATNTKQLNETFSLQKEHNKTFRLSMDNIFSNGSYDITVALRKGDKVISSIRVKDAFSVYGRKHDFAITSPSFKLSTK
ncbi:hypothetical protein D3C72_2169600 [compost metagenome]